MNTKHGLILIISIMVLILSLTIFVCAEMAITNKDSWIEGCARAEHFNGVADMTLEKSRDFCLTLYKDYPTIRNSNGK